MDSRPFSDAACASGSAAANAWLHRAGVGCGSCVLEIVVSSRPVTFTRVHTRQVCSDHTALRARAVLSRSVPALRSGVLDIGLRSRLSGPTIPTRLSGPTIPTPPPGALGALGALSSNARARSLAARSLPLSPLPLDRRSLVELALSLWRLPQLSFAAAADAGSGAAPIWHFFWWVAKVRLASAPLKTAPQRHAAPTAQQALAWAPFA